MSILCAKKAYLELSIFIILRFQNKDPITKGEATSMRGGVADL